MGRIAHVVATSTAGYAQVMTAGRHKINSDELKGAGGTDTGPSPYQLLLGSLAACTSITLRMYAQRQGWELGKIEVELSFSKQDSGPDVIHREMRFSAALSEEQRERLAEIAEKTPVTKTLRQGARIDTRIMAGA
jgi:putative redox protein